MELIPIECNGEIHGDGKCNGVYYFGDALNILPKLLDEYKNKIDLIYMDPPFVTGKNFRFVQRIGEEGWSGNKAYMISHTAYEDMDFKSRNLFLEMMRSVISYSYELLSPSGSLYLHIDYRTSAYMRVMLDEIFGEDRFLNEIIWHYKSGGRAKNHFSRKHDTILFYSKTPNYYFDIKAVGIPRGKDRRNHMKQGVDENGKTFWSIKSGGKEYRYYEDALIYPSDVWDDISHLQQRDPERTGYGTQKPEALLKRIILSSSPSDGLVADFFSGSGTTISTAQKLGRRWIGADSGIFSLHTCRRRILNSGIGGSFNIFYTEDIKKQHKPVIKLGKYKNGNHIKISLKEYKIDKMGDIPLMDEMGLNMVEYWAIGYIEGDRFIEKAYSMRTFDHPSIDTALSIDDCDIKKIAAHFIDIYGSQYFFEIE
ncbi:MAG: site-specific DNA-methyltransferase [Xylanivirga thermophila]|jgi:adenine specific DNA methylase Mod|uniref:DNA methyltransferase n=1 Tax=Xylanivirga thermophila TaxID=2496273 RepID=UPI00101C667D|nr:site-specific DNA-methyltransferase [Xylanivirga thermophila]